VSLSFYLAHHVPAAITNGLRQMQVNVLTVAEDGRADWDDDRLLKRALELGRVVFTQDCDFLVLAARWQQARRDLPAWSTATNCGSRSAGLCATLPSLHPS
jgi:predicted nuclease of predicted toxin-antitoxin system